MKNEKNILSFFSGPANEIKKITWLTRQETIKYTITVIAICVLVATILSLFDLFYLRLMEDFIL